MADSLMEKYQPDQISVLGSIQAKRQQPLVTADLLTAGSAISDMERGFREKSRETDQGFRLSGYNKGVVISLVLSTFAVQKIQSVCEISYYLTRFHFSQMSSYLNSFKQ